MHELHFLASVSRTRLLNINLKRLKGFMLNEDVSVISNRIESKKKLTIRQTVTSCLNIINTNHYKTANSTLVLVGHVVGLYDNNMAAGRQA